MNPVRFRADHSAKFQCSLTWNYFHVLSTHLHEENLEVLTDISWNFKLGYFNFSTYPKFK